MRISLSANTPQQRFADSRRSPTTTWSWLIAAFFIAAASAIAALWLFGAGERGTVAALRITARWSFLLFLPAYCGSALASLFGSRFAELARRSRDFGLSFASAQLVHVGLVLWLIYLAPKANGAMAFFWVGIFCTYLLALLSFPQLHDALGRRAWSTVQTVALDYIALAFAADFILGPLQADGVDKYPLSYVPFALLLIGGAALRVAANARRQR
jgi:hypothetical protein